MNTLPPLPEDDPQRLGRALDLLIEGELSAEESRALQERMTADPAVLSLYLEKVRMDSLLRDHGWTEEQAEPRQVKAPWRTAVRWWKGAAAAVILMGSAAVWLWLPKGAVEIAQGTGLPAVQFSGAAVFETMPGRASPDGQLKLGDGVIMADGSVSIRLPSGVEAVLKSPSRFAITGANRLKLDQGTGWFRVPPAAKGFTVDLPDMEVVDLGTVFTVQVEEGVQQVQVEEGRVEVRQREASMAARSLTKGEKLVRRGSADAVQIVAGASLMNPDLAEEAPEVVFQESLADVPDQPFTERRPLKGAWQVQEGAPQVSRGRFSAQSSFTHLMGRFTRAIEPGENAVVLVSFKSVSPSTLFHSKGFAGVSLFDRDGELFFFGDKSDNSYSWELLTYGKNYRGPREQRRAHDLAIQGSEETFTLRYRQRTGEFEVFRGWGAQGLPLIRGKTDAGLRMDGVRVANGKGGDFSFEALEVSVVKEAGG